LLLSERDNDVLAMAGSLSATL